MKIPTRFKLLGHTINVTYPADKFVEGEGYEGYSSYRQYELQLRPDLPTYPISEEHMAHNFCHELMHFIVYIAEEAYGDKTVELHRSEGFIDLCGGLLHQALTTMEYEVENLLIFQKPNMVPSYLESAVKKVKDKR